MFFIKQNPLFQKKSFQVFEKFSKLKINV